MSAQLQSVSELMQRGLEYAEDNKAVAVIGGVTAVAGLAWFFTRPKYGSQKKPGTFEIGSGAVDRSKVQDEVRRTNLTPYHDLSDVVLYIHTPPFSHIHSSALKNILPCPPSPSPPPTHPPLPLFFSPGQRLLQRVQHPHPRRRRSHRSQRKSRRPRRQILLPRHRSL